MRLLKSFSTKMTAITLVLFLLFCAVSTVSWYYNFTQEATITAEENIGAVIKALSSNFEANLRDIDYVTALVSNKVRTSSNDCLIRYLTTKDDTAALVSDLQESQKYLSNRCSFKTYLNGLAVYNFDGRTCSYGITTPFYEVESKAWYQEIISGNSTVVYVPPHKYSETQPTPINSQVFSIVRPVYDNQGNKIGLVKADIKTALLDTMFDIHSMNGYRLCVIENESKALIYSADNTIEFSTGLFEENVVSRQGSFHEIVDGIEYLAVYVASEVAPWTVVGIVEQDTVISGFIQVRGQMLTMVSVCIIVFILCAVFVTRYITRDLRRLTNAVAAVNNENLSFNIEIKSKDEVETLYKQIGFMLNRIQDLIVDIRKKESEKRQAEMQMLSMQINPHFMHNTLHTIKVLAVMQGVQNIETVSDAFSNMLHLNLDPREFISIAEERDYLLDYIHIQEYRYAGRFTHHISISGNVEQCMVPKLLIQPIVENALEHGLSSTQTEEKVYIRIFDEDGMLKILVKNSGEPFKRSLLDGVYYRGRESSHIGLANIERRIKLLFGDKGALKIYSDMGLFTIVEVTIPMIFREEVGEYEKNNDN